MQINSSHLPLLAATNVEAVGLSLVLFCYVVACRVISWRYQRFCVAKKICTLTTERNKTALAVPKQSNLFIGTWEVTGKAASRNVHSKNVQHVEHDKCTSLLYEVYSPTDMDVST